MNIINRINSTPHQQNISKQSQENNNNFINNNITNIFVNQTQPITSSLQNETNRERQISEREIYVGNKNSAGLRQGQGLLIKGNSTFSGNFENGYKHGYGELSIGKFTFKGYWEKNMLKQGVRLEQVKNKFYTYKGPFKNMQLEGVGKMVISGRGRIQWNV